MTRSSRPVWLGEDSRGWDHARIHRQILTDPRLDPRPGDDLARRGPNRSHVLAVYIGLAIHAETQTGDTKPAQATLARYAGCSTKTVARCIEVLVSAGYVTVEDRLGMASIYRLLPPPTLDPRSEVPSADPGPQVLPTYDPGSGTYDPGSNELEEEREPVNKKSANADGPPREEDSLRDARELCDLLAVKVAKARGEQDRPLVNARWLKDMDLLLRLGPAGVEPRPLDPGKVRRAIEYLFSSLAEEDRGGFCWADQVRSPGALRKYYVQIREARQRREREHHGDAPPVRDPGGSLLAQDWRDAADG